MKSNRHKSTKSAHFSNVPTRQPSVTYVSLENKGEGVLSTPKIKHQRLKSDQSIENNLLQKASQSKATIAEERQKAKAKALQELREAPSIFPGSKKMTRAKSQEEIKAIVDLIPRKVKKRYTKPAVVDHTRPQDVIPAPNYDALKAALDKIVPKFPKEEVCLSKMSIVEKTQYFLQKKSEKINENEKIKMQVENEVCTFKPNTAKPEIRPSVQKPQEMKPKITTPKQSPQKFAKDLRVPAPGKPKAKDPVKPEDSQVFISTSYSQFSPAKRVYSYKEGVNIKKLEKRSFIVKPLIAHSTRDN